MKNYLLTIEYDGTNFSGWQRQPRQRTVQGEIEKVLSKLCCQKIELYGASRTDAGVHALDQKASFSGDFDIPLNRLVIGANGLLPKDVKILSAQEVPAGFHGRFSSKGKKYSYRIINSRTFSVFDRPYNLIVDRQKLDVEKMAEAAKCFLGNHDFKVFSGKNGVAKLNTSRTINNIKVTESGEFSILIEIAGDSFLYKMVRMMVGALINVGMGKHEPEAIKDILEGKLKRIGKTAGPEGLFLEEVYFNPEDLIVSPAEHKENDEIMKGKCEK